MQEQQGVTFYKMNKEEATYWIALAHLPNWGQLNINKLIIKFFHEKQISIEEFFQLNANIWRSEYQLDEKQISDLNQAKSELGSLAFLAESYYSQGYEIIPITSPEYPNTLKSNLKTAYAPAVLYVKGNKKLLEEKSIAIFASKAVSENALKFTDHITKQVTEDSKVILSGTAKGIDKQALDSTLIHNGRSIIVLAQGIMTFASGFQNYYKQIIGGDVLVLSTFYPKTPWKAELSASRNAIIYGLADEIFVADSSEKDGIWPGLLDAIEKGRKIFVRKAETSEKSSNNLLIKKGGIPLDNEGVEIAGINENQSIEKNIIDQDTKRENSLEIKLRAELKSQSLSAEELLKKLSLSWNKEELENYLEKLDFIEIVTENNKQYYRLKRTKDAEQRGLFD